LKEVEEIAEVVKAAVTKIGGGYQFKIGGRIDEERYCAEIMMSWSPMVNPILDSLASILQRDPEFDGFLVHAISQKVFHGESRDNMDKYMCMVRVGQGRKVRRLDILSVAWKSMGAAMLYFTGNTMFNRKMRMKADGMGMKLSNDGLYRTRLADVQGGKRLKTEIISAQTEEEVFEALSERYRDPQDRNL
jgi:DNA polymerase/3'-5' exonuclease PolX